MTAAELLAILVVLEAHLPKGHHLIAVVEREWLAARDREPKPPTTTDEGINP